MRAAVAIKVLRPELGQDHDLVARFVAQRPALLSLRHPNLVAVRELVAEAPTLAFVMDLVPGEDLGALLRRAGPMEARAACGLLSGVARALATLHAGGLVHGAIKPTNILVNPNATMALLTDWRIATIVGPDPLTPQYAAPELATGASAAPSADLYACGAVLYEAVTGAHPLRGEMGGEIGGEIGAELEPPRPAGIPDDVWELISSLLAGSPGSRPTAEETASQLTALAGAGSPLVTVPQQVLPESPVGAPAEQPSTPPAPVPSAPRGHHSRAGLIVGAAVALGALVVLAFIVARAAPGKTATYRFGAETAIGPVRVQRTWTLTSSGRFTQRLTIANASATTTGITYDDVIPKSVATTAEAVTFRPQPDAVLQPDPVVRYAFPDLRPGEAEHVAFTVHLAGARAPASRLAGLAADRDRAARAYAAVADRSSATLTTLAVAPAALSLRVDQVATLTVTGTMRDGSAATSAALAGVTWTATVPGVAEVIGTTVRALQAGVTTLTAHAADATATVAVTVQAAPSSPTPSRAPSAAPSPSPSAKPTPKPTPKALPSPSSSSPRSPTPSPSPPDVALPACRQPSLTPQPSPFASGVPAVNVYRLCDPKTGFRIYTSSAADADRDIAAGDVFESILALLETTPTTSATPLYELRDPQGHDYIATALGVSRIVAQDAGRVVGILGYTQMSTGSPGSGTVPLYELSSLAYGSIYTLDPKERAQLIAQGWKDLGIVYYVS